MDGQTRQKSISVTSRSITRDNILEMLLLTILGMVAILLHARLKYPLNIPGHHGIEFMALLMAGRTLSKSRLAATFSSLGIGIMLFFPVFGFVNPFMGFFYMLPGLFLDAVYPFLKRNNNILLSSIMAGFAYMLIPLFKILLSVTSIYPYAAYLKYGFFVPPVLFYIFGAVGGVAGFGLVKIILKKTR